MEAHGLPCPSLPVQRGHFVYVVYHLFSTYSLAFVAFEKLLELERGGGGDSGECLAHGRHALRGGGVLGTEQWFAGL